MNFINGTVHYEGSFRIRKAYKYLCEEFRYSERPGILFYIKERLRGKTFMAIWCRDATIIPLVGDTLIEAMDSLIQEIQIRMRE